MPDALIKIQGGCAQSRIASDSVRVAVIRLDRIAAFLAAVRGTAGSQHRGKQERDELYETHAES